MILGSELDEISKVNIITSLFYIKLKNKQGKIQILLKAISNNFQ